MPDIAANTDCTEMFPRLPDEERGLTNYLHQISVPRSLKTLNSNAFILKLTI